MVMVTHDVALKNFADRIIWMRDGKIQRIEIVPKHKKQDTVKKVEEELIKLQSKKVISDNQLNKKENILEYRKPTDYKTYLHYKKISQTKI